MAQMKRPSALAIQCRWHRQVPSEPSTVLLMPVAGSNSAHPCLRTELGNVNRRSLLLQARKALLIRSGTDVGRNGSSPWSRLPPPRTVSKNPVLEMLLQTWLEILSAMYNVRPVHRNPSVRRRSTSVAGIPSSLRVPPPQLGDRLLG